MTKHDLDQPNTARSALRQRRRLPAALGALSISTGALFGVCVLAAPAHAQGESDPTSISEQDPTPSETPNDGQQPIESNDGADGAEPAEETGEEDGDGAESEGDNDPVEAGDTDPETAQETTDGSETVEGEETDDGSGTGEDAGTDADVVVAAPDASLTVAGATHVYGAPGAAEPGATITVSDAESGDVLGTGTAVDDGSFFVAFSSTAADGAQLSITATDEAGNESEAASVTVDAVAPSVPVVTDGDENSISGTGEPGATVIVTDSNGKLLGTAVVDEDGQWSVEFASPLAVGDVIAVTAYDRAGNISDSGVYELYEETVAADPADDGAAPAAQVTKTGFNGTADPTVQANGKATAEGLALKTGGQMADVSQRHETGSWAATLLALLGATGAVGTVAVVRARRQHGA